MAQNNNISCTAQTWTLLTNSDVTALRAQNRGTLPCYLQGTVGANAPSNSDGAISLAPGDVLAADLTLAQLFPGVSGANRVYALCATTSVISVSHA